jgi:hypothetical protein
MRQKRDAIITLALFPHEKLAFEVLAASEEVTLSEWIRGRCKGRIGAPADLPERLAAFGRAEAAKQEAALAAKATGSSGPTPPRNDAYARAAQAFDDRQRRGGR